jgi:outer membrane protein OmpA-like peptidoglycan-associated protein
MRGTLILASPRPEPMSMLVNGQRVSLPTLHYTGNFAFQDEKATIDFWAVADSTHPLILKVLTGKDLLQTIRIDLPAKDADVERALATECRAELPGIYFAFNSSSLDPASDPALATVSQMLAKHADWMLAIEGHTDNIGGDAANQTLSTQRAEAVRSALASRYHVAPARLRSSGFGATRPREPNTTIEGRARNRRVELVRPCAK